MAWEWIVKGILLGLAIAAPLGPISILCIKKTLSSGFKNGLISGLGAATADAIYGSIAGFGLSSLTNFLIEYKVFLQCVGGLFICYLGIKSFLHAPNVHLHEQYSQNSKLNSYSGTFFLTLFNPMTIVFFLGVFSAFGIFFSHTRWDIPFLVGGIFLGSIIWWIFLVSTTTFIKINMVRRSNLSLFNKLSGLVMICFGISALIQSFKS